MELARKKPRSIYGSLAERMKAARSRWEAWHLDRITSAAQKGDWRASAWALERGRPEKYGQRLAATIRLSPLERRAQRERDKARMAHITETMKVLHPQIFTGRRLSGDELKARLLETHPHIFGLPAGEGSALELESLPAGDLENDRSDVP
jgi:hypothetical protein